MNKIRNILFSTAAISLLAFVIFSCSTAKEVETYYHPADFDVSASTCFVWTTDFYEIVPKLAAIISKKDKVTLFVKENADLNDIKRILEKYESNPENIGFIPLKWIPANAWLRDFGPVYLVNGRGKKKLVNFLYFRSRLKFVDQISEKQKIPLTQIPLNSTGGSREVNGKGTAILVESHELLENKPKTKDVIEAEMKNALHLKKIIWLKQGIPQDDGQFSGPIYQDIYPNGVNGHVDEFCRFADAQTVLISYVSEEEAGLHPILAEAKNRLDENYRILLESTDQDGNKLNVKKVPFAPLLIFEQPTPQGKRKTAAVTSYMNFIVTNSLVILPSYLDVADDSNREAFQAKENEVIRIFQEVFSSREIITVPSYDLNRFSGGFHCISINKPLGGAVSEPRIP
ncbi:agmatine/peptidylarginine deiminase [Mariniphaga sp.]|uniref:agmatine deiminase family protein n=1 Tax=Mariniphaga sp. TaxID=1954475 RepID=UPI003562F927